MANDSKTIKVGSIIHLKSSEPEWGYLNMLGWTADIPVISFYESKAIRAIPATHLQMNRVARSGSWQILPADKKKQLWDDLESGDKIHLLNMHPGVGYLDTFEHIHRLEPFQAYPMNLGVFTANVPNRDGGGSGTWTICLDPDNQTPANTKITENAKIYLKNDYDGAGFLFAYTADEKANVPNHVYEKNEAKKYLFAAYKDAKKFVFTGSAAKNALSNASYEWQIVSVDIPPECLYRIENQWGAATDDDQKRPWHDAGIFKISDGQKGRVVSLKWEWDGTGEKSQGTVIFKVGETETSYEFVASPSKDKSTNQYSVELKSNEKTTTDEWVIGSRDSQRVSLLEVSKTNQLASNLAFAGKIKYQDEHAIKIRALALESENQRHEIVYDYYNPDLLRGRAQKMRGVIDTTHTLLSDAKQEAMAYSLTDDAKKRVDFQFQQQQLDHLQLLSEWLNGFYTHQLNYLMKQAFKDHREDQTLAPHHIVRRCFQNLAIDHEIIQRATVQRRWTYGQNKEDGAFMSEQAMELLIMDKLAIKALMPFKNLLFADTNRDLAIVTHLSEKTHIRHVPYTAQLILIGVSYDRVPQVGILFDDKSLIGEPFHAFELMAIPHEIAHYVYKYGTINVNGIDRSFPEIGKQFEGVNPYYKWCEEIFADLYGCIVAGPLTVLSMQALLVSIDRGRAWKDDHDHPTPVLRVFILNEMLRILKDVAEKLFASEPDKKKQFNFHQLPDLLDENWTATLEKWGYGDIESLYLSDIFITAKPKSTRPVRIYQHDQSSIHLDQIINVERVISTIRPIIIEFANHLLSHGDFETVPNPAMTNQLMFDIPWVKPNEAEDNDLQTALSRFNQAMRDMTNREFVRKTTTKPKLNESINKDKPTKSIQDYIEGWGEHGPSGGSGGTHF